MHRGQNTLDVGDEQVKGGRGRICRNLRPRCRCLSRSDVAIAIPRRADRKRVRGPDDHGRRPPGLASADWCSTTIMSETFSTIVVLDFEYEVGAGALPKPLCMVAEVLDEHLLPIRTLRLWRDQFGPTPPFNLDPNTLFVAYSAWAEMTCFQVLDWKFPTFVFDQHTAYLAASNILLPHEPDAARKKLRKGLAHACRAYG